MSDAEVAKRMKTQKLVLITFDTDFANILSYPPGDYFGIVLIHIHPQLVHTVRAALRRLLDGHSTHDSFVGKLFVLEAHTFRVWEKEAVVK